MNLLVLLATLGAGIGLSAGLAFNLKLAKALKTPLAASLVNFVVGAIVLLLLWFLGLDGTRPASFPPAWMLLGGLYGATYVTLSLITAARLGVGVSTVAVTLGQILGAIIITSAGWFGQEPQLPSWTAILSAILLVGAVALLAKDRERIK
jgi:bacterial/archaeal transporter family-2 protein